MSTNREATVDRVVIGDGDEIHPGRFRIGIKFFRIGIAVGKIEPAKEPILRAIAKLRMQMEIATAHARQPVERFARQPRLIGHRLRGPATLARSFARSVARSPGAKYRADAG